MTDEDIKLCQLCAKAMGIELLAHCELPFYRGENRGMCYYDPLHDDAQCMALAKRFGVTCDPQDEQWPIKLWRTWVITPDYDPDTDKDYFSAENPDLNRAICECVARMQQAKEKA